MSRVRVLLPREEHKDVREHLFEWMRDLGLSSDTFQDPNIWSCDGCGCIFNTVIDGVIYIDRYAYASSRNDPYPEEECTCHAVPKWVGYDVGTVAWFLQTYSESPWLCGLTHDLQENMNRTCSLCNNFAVVFLNIPYSDVYPNQGGPLWACWEHLGVEPYNEEELYNKYATRYDKINERSIKEVLSQLNKEPEELKKIRETIEVVVSLKDGILSD